MKGGCQDGNKKMLVACNIENFGICQETRQNPSEVKL